MAAAADLKGKTALVVGGTGGIGRAVVLEIARLGAGLIIHGGHNREKGERLVERVRSSGVQASLVMQEIRSLEDAEVLGVASETVDILICAFGPYLQASLAGMNMADWSYLTGLNLALPGYLVSRALSGMSRRDYGRIVLFGATGGDTMRGYTTVAAYSAAKIGLGVLAKSVARGYGAKNITCNVVTPGYVDTEYITDEQRTEWTSRSRTRRLQQPEQIGRFVAEMICAGGDLINGAIIDLSAGMI
jgi:3-oxoacyl-[acyl-carrier protein] reductase